MYAVRVCTICSARRVRGPNWSVIALMTSTDVPLESSSLPGWALRWWAPVLRITWTKSWTKSWYRLCYKLCYNLCDKLCYNADHGMNIAG